MVYSLPSGSPYCQIDHSNMAKFGNGHSPQSSQTGFSANFTSENGKYKIILSRKNVPIHGVLMYVTGADKSNHLGSFAPNTGYKFVNGCSGGQSSTVTHGDSSEKRNTEFIWTPAPGERGPFTLNAILTGFKNPWSQIIVNEQRLQNDAQQSESNRAILEDQSDETAVQLEENTHPYEKLPELGAAKNQEENQDIQSSTTNQSYEPTQTLSSEAVSDIYFNGEQTKEPIVLMLIAISLFGLLA